MELKYRVKGIVERAFILRGAYFPIGNTIDIYVAENELEFVKGKCKVEKVTTNAKQPIEIPKPMLEETKTEIENKSQEVRNELQPKPSRNGYKGKSKSSI